MLKLCDMVHIKIKEDKDGCKESANSAFQRLSLIYCSPEKSWSDKAKMIANRL